MGLKSVELSVRIATVRTDREGKMLTHQEMWGKTCKIYGQFIPPTTFRDWIKKMCLLDIKAVYSPEEVGWVLELAKIARRYPKGSPQVKKQLHKMMRDILNEQQINN